MIKFERVTYKNILSVGQAPITIDLATHRLTGLYGKSGSGKSLFLDALSFGLFGKAFRDIPKTELVNSINGKGLFVEVLFSIGDRKFKILRGIKPAIFEIYVDGQMLNQEAHTKDQQKYLEDQILKMNWKIFIQIVMLGAANYTPFLRLKPGDRKRMVESILGIDIFSTMNALVKTKISDSTIAYKAILDKKETIEQQVAYLQAQQEAFEMKQAEVIKAQTETLIKLRDKKKDLDLSILTKEQELEVLIQSFDPNVEVPEFKEIFDEKFNETFTEEFTEKFAEIFEEKDDSYFAASELVSLHATKTAEIKSIKEKLAHIKKHTEFYTSHDTCPTCSQPIGQDFRNTATKDLQGQMEDLSSNQAEHEKAIAEIKIKAEQIKAEKTAYSNLRMEFYNRKMAFEKREDAYKSRQQQFEFRRREFEDRQRGFESRLRQHEEKLKKVSILIEEKKKQFDKQIELKRKDVESIKNQVTVLLTEAKLIKESIEEKKNKPLLDNTEKITSLNVEFQSLSTELDLISNKLKMLRELQLIIKDDGVKSEILKKYVPTLNKTINQCLTRMGLFISFELDQDFKDTIKSRHRDILSYAGYSEGEKQRIDLAVLLAWRELAQAQSAVNTNLLILDEVMDSYLDSETADELLRLMKSEQFQGFNIVIISHKPELSDSFDRTIQFQFKNNFTSIVSNR